MKNIKNFTLKRISLMSLVWISVFLCPITSLSVKLTMDTQSADNTVLTYNTNVGECSCDLHQFSCDVFCCCDTACSQTQVASWDSNKECLNNGQLIERSCDQLSKGGFFSFQDLACVYYSNRGNISYFYSYPDAGSINYPTPQKFVSVASTATAINTFSSTATTSPYSSSQLLAKMKKDTALKYIEVWAPIAAGKCSFGYLNISKSQTYSCQYELNAQTCLSNSKLFQGAIKFCLNGECTTTSDLSTFTAATLSNTGTICENLITEQRFALTVSSTGSSYVIDSIIPTFIRANIDYSLNKKYQIKTVVTITNPSTVLSYSGNPGYLTNKPVKLQNAAGSYSLFNIADLSGNCVTAGTSQIDLLFGQNRVFSCISSNPCSANLYIDKIIKQQAIKVPKWARHSTDTILVSGTGSTLNSCDFESVNLNILYTSAGWVADLQNYILGAEIITQKSSQSSWNKKYLKINWYYVDPQNIDTPPTNEFYQYFSYLWKPLRQYFGVY